ncbi:MAG: nitrilase-related carbon-nitrogen hydrolase [Syntrophorhabdales bacterium]
MDPSEFSGGAETNRFLIGLGFRVVAAASGARVFAPRRGTITRAGGSKHSERCPECKEAIEKLLGKVYGTVKRNHRFDVGTHPDDFKGAPFYEALTSIFTALQDYRGFKKFVKVAKLPHCDFFIRSPGFILEFDESQHFTKPRAIALERYPANLNLGFDRKRWLNHCLELNSKDDDPPFRDEQRAWYDTLRDFCGLVLGIPTVRILPEEAQWCKFNVNAQEDISRFEGIIERKLGLCRRIQRSHKSFMIGLAFPELKKHDVDHFCKVLERSSTKPELMILPEGFESIRPKCSIAPEHIAHEPEVTALIKKYTAISNRYRTGIIVGFQVDYDSALTSGGGNDQYALAISGEEDPYIYHKHSTSRYNAFFDSTWSVAKNLRVIRMGDKRIGVSICHDSYISLIPRSLKQKSAEVWVNISYQNVRPAIWGPIHHTRAVENDFISVCTLHRNKHESNPQREPYAFSDTGKIRLIDLQSNHKIDDIPFEDRPGKIYVFDLHDYQVTEVKQPGEADLSSKAQPLIIKWSTHARTPLVDGSKLIFKDIDIESFIHRPEKLWKICLDNGDKVVLFWIRLQNHVEWERYRDKVMSVIKGRTIEFSTLFLFLGNGDDVLMAAYRSSNYKDCRVFYPGRFPFKIDVRYLKGLESTYHISLNDCRSENRNIYFQKVQQMVDFIL